MLSSIDRCRLVKAGIVLSSLPFGGFARAQEAYPSKSIHVIVGLPAGGVADNSLRSLTGLMQPVMGQPFVIDKKPGGSFAPAMNVMAQAKAAFRLRFERHMFGFPSQAWQ